jgi:hypothetical protein
MATQISIIKFFLRFEKEEAWLESMSASGWHLVRASYGWYKFQGGQPEKRVYRIDCRNITKQADLVDYVSLFTDSGWTSVSPKKNVGNYYFYALADQPGKDIFSDKASKAGRYLRYAQLTGISLIPMIPIYGALYATGALKMGNWGYLTPGLWQMTGAEFTRHFLFETPFVLLRALGWMLPLLVVLACLIFIYRYYRIYKKELGKD